MTSLDPAPGRQFLREFAALADSAMRAIKGPRSIMLPDDPEGLTSWFEPIMRMIASHSITGDVNSLGFYRVPNCIQHDAKSAVFIRRARWQRSIDHDQLRKQLISSPSVAISYQRLKSEQVIKIDELVFAIDRALPSFPFSVEGLDLSGSSGFSPLPTDAQIYPQTIRCELIRVTRFTDVDLHWMPVDPISELDLAWRSLGTNAK